MTLDEILSNKEQFPDEQPIQLAEGVTVTLGQLRAGYLKDADYRRKTAALAEERRRFEAERAQHLAALQEAEVRLQQMATEVLQRATAANRAPLTPAQAEQALDDDPRVAALRQEIEALKQRAVAPLAQAVAQLGQYLHQQQLAAYAQQHRMMLAALKQRDPDLDENALIEFAKANAIPRLDIAYMAMKKDELIQKAKEEGKKEGFEAGKRAAAVPRIPVRRPVATPEATPKSINELVEQASQDQEVLGPLLGAAGEEF